MNSPFAPHMCRCLIVALAGCRGASDGARAAARTAQHQTTATSTPAQSIQSLPQCPGNSAIKLRATSFARADSSARALLARAGMDSHNDCADVIAETDSSVIVSYSSTEAPKEAPATGRVLHYGGGVVVEVLRSGRARWLYATQ